MLHQKFGITTNTSMNITTIREVQANLEKRLVELKVKVRDLEAVRDRLMKLGAKHIVTVEQIDTYFSNVCGRLKLREWEGGARLIYYVRPDLRGVKRSSVRLVEVENPQKLKAVLKDTLGIRNIVKKVREIYRWGDVKVHLDKVEGLGFFVEFEWEDGDPETLKEMFRTLGLDASNLIAGSYSDLIANKK